MTSDRMIPDDLITAGTVSEEKIKEALALVESICGPLLVTCLKHGPGCEMRSTSCIISTRHEVNR